MKFLNSILSRIVLVVLALLIQITWIVVLVLRLGEFFQYANLFLQLFSLAMVFYIAQKDSKAAFKLAWIVPILLFPLFGGLIYLLFGTKSPTQGMRKRLERSQAWVSQGVPDSAPLIDRVTEVDPHAGGQMRYLKNMGNFAVYEHTSARYFPLGDDAFPVLLEELRKAKRFIFIEFFIIAQGEMWNSILEILEEKAAEGVDVRVIYDDVGSLTTLPYDYEKQLEKKGIKCLAFNPFKPILSIVMNNRDHRKIIVIDGNVGFTGGINLADEYINRKVRFGHWKDNGVLLRGEAVWNLTMLFLTMWNAFVPTDEDLECFKPYFTPDSVPESDGYVLPYGDSPLDNEDIGENTYLAIIHNAKRYLYICTPYLIIDEELADSLTMAAKRGVDVRLITPGIPDKRSAFTLTRSHYEELIQGGVQIFEYTPGFVHAKSFVCDDEIATVGTINLDYRSLYLHFECGVYFYRSSLIGDVKRDFLETQQKCTPVVNVKKRFGLINSLFYSILRLLAPLF